MAYGQGQEDSSTQALEVFGEKQGEVDVNQLMEMLKVLLPLIMQQVANPAQLTFEGKKNLMAKQVPAPQGMAQLPARGMQGPPMPQPQGPPTPLRHRLGAPAGHSWPGLPRREADPKMPSMIPRVPQVRPQGGGGGNMLQMLMQMMGGGR